MCTEHSVNRNQSRSSGKGKRKLVKMTFMNRHFLVKEKVAARRGCTPVSIVLRKSVRFFIINTFFIIKNTFQVETWAICYLSDSKTQERGLKELNTKTFLGKPAPQTPLDSACAFGPRLGNRSVFIPDPRLVAAGKTCYFCLMLARQILSLLYFMCHQIMLAFRPFDISFGQIVES